MVTKLLALLPILSGGAIYKWVKEVESRLRPEFRQSLSRWVVDPERLGPSYDWPLWFSKLLDRVFGPRHFSLRCILTSTGISLVLSVIALRYAAELLGPAKFVKSTTELSPGTYSLLAVRWTAEEQFAHWFKTGEAYLMLGAALVVDYISLLETRLVLRLMSRQRRLIARLALTAFDALATFLIAVLLTSTICATAWGIMDGGFWSGWKFLTWNLLISPLGRGMTVAWVPVLLVALLTSVWLWLYLAAVIITAPMHRSLKWFDLEEHPLTSLVLVGLAVALVAYTPVAFIFAFAS